jgi:hypothetical protein
MCGFRHDGQQDKEIRQKMNETKLECIKNTLQTYFVLDLHLYVVKICVGSVQILFSLSRVARKDVR